MFDLSGGLTVILITIWWLHVPHGLSCSLGVVVQHTTVILDMLLVDRKLN